MRKLSKQEIEDLKGRTSVKVRDKTAVHLIELKTVEKSIPSDAALQATVQALDGLKSSNQMIAEAVSGSVMGSSDKLAEAIKSAVVWKEQPKRVFHVDVIRSKGLIQRMIIEEQ